MSSLTLKGKASDQAPALANIQAAQKRPVSQPVSQPKPKAYLGRKPLRKHSKIFFLLGF
ncbi:hypothetical protein ERO13_D07G169700v2 [Gossypium hirsutum]|nr:hypothetical protein ERO13_D07G169700v2 [Gossypium hirsutum]